MTKSVFANSYPWLFPGGVGDVYDMKRGGWDVKEWGRHLLRYYDGRFLNDQFFSLFVFNTIQRHENNSEGNFFSTASRLLVKTHRPLRSLRNNSQRATRRTYKCYDIFQEASRVATTTGE